MSPGSPGWSRAACRAPTASSAFPRACVESPACPATPGTRPRRVVGTPRYNQYRGDPPPCDRTHRTPPGPPSGRTTGLSTQALALNQPPSLP
ncbi:hypothetical protein DEJ49_12635 [Streptomyces venezuelae]|uniref:Uncharacterized protein n=1 Tax=Streptomyces venezuelae TaxID=54571 RepID=A0A5P2CHR6_STRVZ|nr:hypothetical protein DEJ49_12635 [Streptomyces venezuelae]